MNTEEPYWFEKIFRRAITKPGPKPRQLTLNIVGDSHPGHAHKPKEKLLQAASKEV